jgi:hypothetical protein
MFKSIWGKWLALVACLLAVSVSLPTASAGFVNPNFGAGGPPQTPIDGEYAPTLISQATTSMSLSLGSGTVTAPSGPNGLTQFTPSGFTVNSQKQRNGTTSVSLTDPSTNVSDIFLTMTVGTGNIDTVGPNASVTFTIKYNLAPAVVGSSGAVITAGATFDSVHSNLPPNYTPPNPALLTIIFEPLSNGKNVNLDPSYPDGYDQSGQVIFSIDPVAVPEPGSLVHLTWLVIVGVVGAWWRCRSAARTSLEQLAPLGT